MAAGKHGGYRTNELKYRESVLDFNRKDHYHSSKQDDEYRRYRPDDRVLNRHREFECRKDRYGRDSVTSSRRDTREKEEKNHDYYSSSSRGNSGRKLSSRTEEREPADLAIGWDKETLKLKMEVQMPPTKKQKVSPVECDREVKKQQLQSHVGKEEGRVSNFLSKSLSISPGVCDPQSSPYSANELSGLFGLDLGLSSSGSSCLTHQERYGGSDQEMGQLEPTRNIAASRWADEDEGEIIDVDDVVVASHSTKVETPELGELSKEVRPHDESECPVNEEKEEVDEEDLNGNETTDCLGDFQEENDSAPTQRSFNMLQGCRSVFEFERIGKISEGTYGVVYKAIDKKTGDIVALKKWKEKEEETEGFPITAMREINILISSHHPSIVDVKEVVMGNKDDVYMVMEYMEHDLKKVIETMEHPFSLSEAKCLMLQLLKGVKYLHDNWILHRDLKSSNILLNDKGELKICDFGMSRQYGSPLKPYTALVVTLWYRAPELLLGAKQYSTAIDMWSLGCIMAELVAKKPLFSGTSELDQLHKIFRVLGTPSEETWPGFSKLPGIKVNFVKQPYNLLRKIFPSTSFTGSPCLTDAGVDLLNRLLTYDPEKRMTAEEAINHEWFCEFPLPKSKDSMPKFALPKSKNLKPTIPQDPRYRILTSPDPLEDQGGINNGNCSLILVIFFG